MSCYKTCPRCGVLRGLGEVCDCLDVEARLLIDHTKNELPGATNTEQLEGGKQSLPDTDSTSTITENGGFVK